MERERALYVVAVCTPRLDQASDKPKKEMVQVDIQRSVNSFFYL